MARRYRKSGTADNELGQIVRRQMRKLKLSRKDLAKRLDVDASFISQLFYYQHQLRYGTIEKLADALEVSVDRVERANRDVIRRVAKKK